MSLIFRCSQGCREHVDGARCRELDGTMIFRATSNELRPPLYEGCTCVLVAYRPMKKEYEPRGDEEKVAYLVEECGEVLAAVGKSIRWGWESVNPELPSDEQETNRDWVLREMQDVERAIKLVREDVLGE